MEPFNFADDCVQCCYGQKGAIFKNWSDALFIDLQYGGRAGSPFLLTKSLIRWYLVLQCPRMSSKCFWKVNLESKVIPRNFI